MSEEVEVNQFELEAVTVLLSIQNLSDVERSILEHLQQAAINKNYWESIARLHGNFIENGADWDVHILNIKAKAAMAGLTPIVQEAYDRTSERHRTSNQST